MKHRRRGRALRRRYGRADAAGGQYMVRFVHKISPSDKDVAGPIHLGASDLKDKKSLGAALRKGAPREGYNGQFTVLSPGQGIRSYRHEADGKIVVFPGGRSIWHAIVLTQVGG